MKYFVIIFLLLTVNGLHSMKRPLSDYLKELAPYVPEIDQRSRKSNELPPKKQRVGTYRGTPIARPMPK